MINLGDGKGHRVPRQLSAIESSHSYLEDHELNQQELDNEDALENVTALLEEYEKRKRGFLTNPFLQDESEKSIKEDKLVCNTDEEKSTMKDSNRDSEVHRRAWGDTVGVSIEFALALSVSRIKES